MANERMAGEMRRYGDWETGRLGDRETRRQGDRETRRQGDTEIGRQGDWEIGSLLAIRHSPFAICHSPIRHSPFAHSPFAIRHLPFAHSPFARLHKGATASIVFVEFSDIGNPDADPFAPGGANSSIAVNPKTSVNPLPGSSTPKRPLPNHLPGSSHTREAQNGHPRFPDPPI